MTSDPIEPVFQRFRDANGTPGEVFVVAHRGLFLEDAVAVLAENSLPAIEQARQQGVDMVEIDVHKTHDGSLLVIHDDTLERTTDAHGPVRNLSRKDVRDISLVHPSSRKSYQVSPPFLEEVFAALGPEMMVNVELKSGIEDLYDVAVLAEKCGVSNQVTIKSNLDDGTDYLKVKKLIQKCNSPVDLIPVVIDRRDGFEGFEEAVRILEPNCVECVVDYAFGPDDGYNLLERRGTTRDGGVLFSRKARRLAVDYNTRLFVNTLYVNPVTNNSHQWNGGRDCELARFAPDSVYGFWISHGATVIQSDDAPYLLNWLRNAGFHA